MSFSFKNISKNRQFIMGIAGLFIMFCHNTIYNPHWFYKVNFGYLRYFFQIGVDVFFLLSGLGCYFSLSKSVSVTDFYKKRAKRIFPSYLIFFCCITVVNFFINRGEILQKMYSFSPFSFIISDDLTLWFIPAILLLYLISPLLFNFIKKIDNTKILLFVIVAGYVLAIVLCLLDVRKSSILFLRIPSFLFGMLIGYCEKNDNIKPFTTFQTFLTFLSFFVILIFYFVVKRYDLFDAKIIYFPLCVVLTVILSSFNRFPKTLAFLGTVTLETYLVHTPLLSVTKFISYKLIPIDLIATWFNNILAVVISIIIAWALSKVSRILVLKNS